MSSNERTRRSASKCIPIRIVPPRPTRPSRSSMRPCHACPTQQSEGSTIRLVTLTLFRGESHKEAQQVISITSIGAISGTLNRSSCPQRNSLTSCSLGSNRGVDEQPIKVNTKDSTDSSADMLTVQKKMQTWAFFCDKCSPCFYSFSSRSSPACSLEVLSRMVRTTITVCNAPITSNNS